MWFIAATVIAATILRQQAASTNLDLDTLYNRILSDDPQYGYLKHGESFEYLKEVRSLEPERDIANLRSNDYNNELKRCDKKNIDILVKQLLRSKGQDKDNKHQEWSHRVSECKHIWRTNLKSEVVTLTLKEKQLIQSMAKELIKKVTFDIDLTTYQTATLLSRIDTPELAWALESFIVPYFEAHTHCKIDQFLADEYKKIFQRECTVLLANLCSSVRVKLGKFVKLFDLFIYESEINYREDDKFIRDWLNGIEFCKIVRSRGESFSEELYKLLKKKKEKCPSGHDGSCLPVISAKMKQVKVALQKCLLKRG